MIEDEFLFDKCKGVKRKKIIQKTVVFMLNSSKGLHQKNLVS